MFTKKLILVLITAIALAGCGDDSSGPDTTDNMSQGWNYYESGNYPGAISKFNAALISDPTNADAFNGLGWSWTILGNTEMGRDNFLLAIENGMDDAAPYAGIAFSSIDIETGVVDEAISAATTALEISPTWTFSHRASVDWHDLRVVLAQAYYYLGQIELANEQVVALDGTPSDDNLILLEEIERLSNLYAG